MPKITDTPKTRTQINADSDAKRGVKAKTYKLKIELVDDIATLSDKLGITQAEVIGRAIELLKNQ